MPDNASQTETDEISEQSKIKFGRFTRRSDNPSL